jgi:hypothetical protein
MHLLIGGLRQKFYIFEPGKVVRKARRDGDCTLLHLQLILK